MKAKSLDEKFDRGEDVLDDFDTTAIKKFHHPELRSMMKELNLNYRDIAKITGHSYASVKSMLQPGNDLPRWLKLTLYVWRHKTLQKQ